MMLPESAIDVEAQQRCGDDFRHEAAANVSVERTAPIWDDARLSERTIVMDATALAQVTCEIAEARTTEETVAQIVLFATRTLGTQFASVTMLQSRGRFETLGSTSDPVTRADRLQYSNGEGPCVDAATESQTVTSQNLAAEARWPQWAPAAAGIGFLSVLSTELHAGGVPIGSLNMYGTKTRQFAQDDVRMAQIFASHASVALAAVRSVEGLQQALHNRTVIGQAQGMLMERFGVDAERAFAILRRYSQDLNIKLAEVARGLVQTSMLPESAAKTNFEPFAAV